MTLTSELQFAVDLARGAGQIVLEHYGKVRRLVKNHAAAHDEAVTEADRAAQRFIVAGLHSQYPADGVIGEESDAGDAITADVRDPMGRTWVIDPIDGTNNFIAGLGAFAVCIGLMERGMPILGVVFDVTRNVMYKSAKGMGVFADAVPMKALQTPLDSSSMLMLTSSLVNAHGQMPQFPSRWLNQAVWKVRIIGSAALETAMVAAGVAHGAVTVNGKLWDIAAPASLVLEAGGVLSNLQGQPIFPYDLQGYTGAKVPFIAAGPAAHAELLKEVQT